MRNSMFGMGHLPAAAGLLLAACFALASPARGAPNYVCGDVDGSFTIGASDRSAMENYLLFDGSAPPLYALGDVTGDLRLTCDDLNRLDSFINTGTPYLYCHLVEQQFHGNELAQAAQVLQDTVIYGNPALKYQIAAGHFGTIASHMQNLQAQGIDIDPAAVAHANGLRNDCLAISQAVMFNDYQTVETSLLSFQNHFHHAYIHGDLAAVDMGLVDHFLDADGDLTNLADVASGIWDPGVLPDHYRALDSLVAMGSFELNQKIMALLGITDPQIQNWLELDDPEVRNQLDSLLIYLDDPEVIDWLNAVRTDAEGLHAQMMSKAFEAGTVYLGYDIGLGADAMVNALPVLYLVGFWSDEDCNICDVRNCTVTDVAVVNWRSSCKGEKAKRGLLEVATKIKKPPKLPVGGAPLAGTAIKAVKALQKALLEAEPGVRICIKVKWEHCENVEGWFCTVKRWVEKTSDWVEVPGPGILQCWPKPSTWGQGTTQSDIEDAIDAKKTATCQ